jgi:cytochrome c551/c552
VPVAVKAEAGLAAVRAIAEADGYEQVAAQYAGQAEARRRMSRRRAPAWADEP